MTRRDQCHVVGKRANRLNSIQAAYAWYFVAAFLEDNAAELDIPKFKHLLYAIRRATTSAVADCQAGASLEASKVKTAAQAGHPQS